MASAVVTFISGLQLGETLLSPRLKQIASRFGVKDRIMREVVSSHSGIWCPSCTQFALIMADRCCSECNSFVPDACDSSSGCIAVQTPQGDDQQLQQQQQQQDRRAALVERVCEERGIGRVGRLRALEICKGVPASVDPATAAAAAIYKLLQGGTMPMPARVVASWTGAQCPDSVLSAWGVRRVSAIDVIDYAQLLARGINVAYKPPGPSCKRLAAALAELSNTNDSCTMPAAALAYLMTTSPNMDGLDKAMRTQRMKPSVIQQAKKLTASDQLGKLLMLKHQQVCD